MKLTIFLVAALAVSFSSAFPRSVSFALINDLQDFVNLLPNREMMNIMNEYLDTDEEVQKFVAFQNSDDYKKYVIGKEHVQEYQALLQFLQSQGIDVYAYLDFLHDFLDIPPYVPPPVFHLSKTGKGLKGLGDDWDAIIPFDKIRNLSNQKLQTSEEYKHMYNLLNSPTYKKLFCACDASEEFQKVVGFGKDHGYDESFINEFYFKFINIEMTRC